MPCFSSTSREDKTVGALHHTQKTVERRLIAASAAASSLGSYRIPKADLTVPRGRAARRGERFPPARAEAPGRLHRLASLVALPLGYDRSRPRVDDSNLAVPRSGGN